MALVGNILQTVGYAFLPLLLLPFLVLAVPQLCPLGRHVVDIVDEFTGFIGSLIRWLFPALVLSVVFAVFALSIFGWASPKLDESAIYLHAFALMLGMAPTLLADQHVRVDVVYGKLGERSRALVNIIGFYVLLVPLMLAVVWNAQSTTAFSWAIFEGSPDADGIRGQFLLKTLIPVFAITMLAQGVAVATRSALELNRIHDA